MQVFNNITCFWMIQKWKSSQTQTKVERKLASLGIIDIFSLDAVHTDGRIPKTTSAQTPEYI